MVPFLSTVTRVSFYIFGNLLTTPFPTCKCTNYLHKKKLIFWVWNTEPKAPTPSHCSSRFLRLNRPNPGLALNAEWVYLARESCPSHMNNLLECCWWRAANSFGLPGRFFKGSISRLLSTSHKTDTFQTACAEATIKPQNFYSLPPTPGHGKCKPCWMHAGICHDYSPREELWAWKL